MLQPIIGGTWKSYRNCIFSPPHTLLLRLTSLLCKAFAVKQRPGTLHRSDWKNKNGILYAGFREECPVVNRREVVYKIHCYKYIEKKSGNAGIDLFACGLLNRAVVNRTEEKII